MDAGSTGCDTFSANILFMDQSKLTIRAYLNVCSTGLDSLPQEMEDVDPGPFDEDKIAAAFQMCGPILQGLKLRTSRAVVKELGYAPLRRTLELAGKLGVSVMVHCTDPPGEMDELLFHPAAWRCAYSYVYEQGQHYSGRERNCLQWRPMMPENGECCLRLRMRGLTSRLRWVSRPSGRGFLPDFIATDLTRLSMNLRPTAFNMANQMSKYYMMGIGLDALIACCTSIPARNMGLASEAGCLSPGAWGDVAVFKLEECNAEFGDHPYSNPQCQLRQGSKRFRPVFTVKNGEAVFRDTML